MRSLITIIIIIFSNYTNAHALAKSEGNDFIETVSSNLLIQEYFPLNVDSIINASVKNSYRIELGLGGSVVGNGGGLNGRFAMVLLFGTWGSTIRFTAHDGGEGKSVSGWFHSYRPKETFYERAFMLSHASKYGKKSKFIKSAE